MSKLYLFAIGGTGSRVLRAMINMLAAGVEIDADQIVPIIVDPDLSNGDLTRTVGLMNDYNIVRGYLSFPQNNPNRFFRTAIKTDLIANGRLTIAGTQNKSFKNFIGLSGMSRANQALAGMLFSKKNLDASMTVGFRGNPNIGSVVLNQLSTSADFTAFANSFVEGDRIFIISSIFGGTGASGFPLLLKTLRHNQRIPNHALINAAPIGAISVLPYFNLKQPTDGNPSEIDSGTFISKTKSALSYYEKNIGNDIDTLYFIADVARTAYENHDGGEKQGNIAHLIEFFAATAAIDFANEKDIIPNTPAKYKELGIKNSTSPDVTFPTLNAGLHNMLYTPLTRFALMASTILNRNETEIGGWAFNTRSQGLPDIYRSTFYTYLKIFAEKNREWFEEMRHNDRSLALYDMERAKIKPFEIVTGVTPRGYTGKIDKDYDLIANCLNSASKNWNTTSNEDRFMEMFHRATDDLIKHKL